MDKLRNSTREAFAAFTCSILKRCLAEGKRVGFFKNAYRNVCKAYFDRRTTQSEFCFETNILCNRRSVLWRTTKFEMRKTALQNKLTLNNYSSNGKQTAKRTSDFIKFYADLELFEANSGHLQNIYRL